MNSNPDSVYGNYPNQSTDWIDTGMRVTGEEVVIEITGSWTPWPSASSTQEGMEADLDSCLDRSQADYNSTNQAQKNYGMCAKRYVDNSVVHSITGERNPSFDVPQNCLCYKGDGAMGMANAQNDGFASCDAGDTSDPNRCVCQIVDDEDGDGESDGTATEGDCVVHYTLSDKRKSDMSVITDASEQGGRCRFNKGMGLYLGLFGVGGNEQPKRVYHLFTQDERCPVDLDRHGRCAVTLRGGVSRDRTQYIYTNSSGRYIKDDNSGNICSSSDDLADDVYHGKREVVKLKIHDTYYRDNFGSYNVRFLSGFYTEGEKGILESIVNMIEEILLGKVDINNGGEREGGILMFLYKAIVQNSDFTLVVQLALVLYIAFFGISTLAGLTDITKKELVTKILQISVILMFTSTDGWQMYFDFFVKFFKVGMDQVITRVALMANPVLGQGDATSDVIVAAMQKSANPDSMGAKFAYPDTVIKMLFGEVVTKKIWSLFFYSFFGFVYIILIYMTIFYFLYAMSIVAFVYCILLTKLVIGLILGPIFLIFMLFKQTNEYFRKWITFLASRSLEALLLFSLMYILVRLIEMKFNAFFGFRSCYEGWDLWLFKFTWLVADKDTLPGYNLSKWLLEVAEVFIVIFAIKEIIMQIPKLSGGLIAIGGASNSSSYAQQGFNIAQGTMKGIFSFAAGKAASVGKRGSGIGMRGALKLGSKIGVSKAINAVGQYSPIRSPRSMLRDKMIDKAIDRYSKQANDKGLTGKDRDRFIRDKVLNDNYSKRSGGGGLRQWANKNKNKSALLNLNTETICKRLDKKLLQDPMKKFLKDKAEEYKQNIDPDKPMLGDRLKMQLQTDALKWAQENTSVSKSDHEKMLRKFTDDNSWHNYANKTWFSRDKWGMRRSFFDDLTHMGANRAARKSRYGTNEDSKESYMSYLRSRQFNKLYKGSDQQVTMDEVKERSTYSNKFLGQVEAKDRKFKMNPYRLSPISKFLDYDQKEGSYKSNRKALLGNGFQDRKDEIAKYHEQEKDSARAKFGGDLYKRQVDKKQQEQQDKLNRERNYFKDSLAKMMVKNYTAEMNKFEKRLGKAKGDEERALILEQQNNFQKKLRDTLSNVAEKVGKRMLYDRSLNMDNIRDGLVNVKLDDGPLVMNGQSYDELSLFEIRKVVEQFGEVKDGNLGIDKDKFNKNMEEANENLEAAEQIIKDNEEESDKEDKINPIEEREDIDQKIKELDESEEKTKLEKMLALRDEVDRYYSQVKVGNLATADRIRLKFELEELLRDPNISGESYRMIMELIVSMSDKQVPEKIERQGTEFSDHVDRIQEKMEIDPGNLSDNDKEGILVAAQVALDQNNIEIIAIYNENAQSRQEALDEIIEHKQEVAELSAAISVKESAAEDNAEDGVDAITSSDPAFKAQVEEIEKELEIEQDAFDQFTEQQVAEINMMDESLTGEVIVTDLEIEFGKDIGSALALDAGSIIVEAADISIGGGSKKENNIDQALKGSYEAVIKGHELKIKSSKNSKKFLEYEAQNLDKIINSKHSSAEDKRSAEISKRALESEISSLETTIGREERSKDAAQEILKTEVTYGKTQ